MPTRSVGGAQSFEHQRRTHCCCADRYGQAEDKPVGTASLVEIEDPEDEPGPWVSSVYLLPEHRGKGGASTLGRLEGEARRLCHHRLVLSGAAPDLRRLGYTLLARQSGGAGHFEGLEPNAGIDPFFPATVPCYTVQRVSHTQPLRTAFYQWPDRDPAGSNTPARPVPEPSEPGAPLRRQTGDTEAEPKSSLDPDCPREAGIVL